MAENQNTNQYTFRNMAKKPQPPLYSNRQTPAGPYNQNQPRVEKLTVHHSYNQANGTSRISHREQVPPIRPRASSSQSTPPSVKKLTRPAPKKVPRKRSDIREFMLGFTVGLIFFGIAAFFICKLLIGILL